MPLDVLNHEEHKNMQQVDLQHLTIQLRQDKKARVHRIQYTVCMHVCAPIGHDMSFISSFVQ